jgi:glutamyl-tRNA synthetase
MTIKTRFAPSPTGMLHVGNARTAIINYLYARKYSGIFILRLDDTDSERSLDKYKESIKNDLKFLGLEWDLEFKQSDRYERYNEIKKILLSKNRLYPCFETSEELEIKRKLQLSSGKPPIYDRSALLLTDEQINNLIKSGKKPHYRFFIDNRPIIWNDLIKNDLHYDGSNLSDPIVIREDGSMTYMLCSVIDDIDYDITHIIRGEDHVSNTAIQMQMFEALNSTCPTFGHLSLVTSKDEKISKRNGGFEIATLRDNLSLEPMSINSFFSFIGSSKIIYPYKNLKDLILEFNIKYFSKSPTIYMQEDLERLNHKLLLKLEFSDIKEKLKLLNLEDKINEQFWLIVRPNLKNLKELEDWWNICHHHKKVENLDKDLLSIAADLLPHEIDINSWHNWTKNISNQTGIVGKQLFQTLRLAITSRASGPEMSNILLLIGREEIIKRLNIIST